MKNYNFTRSSLSLLSAATLLASVAASCTKQVQEIDPVIPTTTKVELAASIESPTGKASALRGSGFLTDDETGLYVVAYLKPNVIGRLEVDGNYVDNVKYTLDATPKWVPSKNIFYPTVDVSVYGYAPFNANFNPTAKPTEYPFTVEANQSLLIADNDFMTAKIEKQGAVNTPIELTFYHRLSRVDVKFKVPSSFKGKTITSLESVKLKGFKSQAVIDLTTPYTYTADGASTGGTYPKPASALPTSAVIDITPHQSQNSTIGSTATDGTEYYIYEAIVVPQTLSAGSGFIEIIANYAGGGQETFFYQVPANEVREFKAAKSTLVTLTFQNDYPILLGTVSIEAWAASTPASGEVVNREVFNTFNLTLAANQTTKIATAKITTVAGLVTPQTKSWIVPVTHQANSDAVTFAFDGTRDSPESYPFKVTGVKFYDASNTELTASEIASKNKEITTTGVISTLD